MVYDLTLEALGPTSQFFISPCTENIEIPSVFIVFVKGPGNSDKIHVLRKYSASTPQVLREYSAGNLFFIEALPGDYIIKTTSNY